MSVGPAVATVLFQVVRLWLIFDITKLHNIVYNVDKKPALLKLMGGFGQLGGAGKYILDIREGSSTEWDKKNFPSTLWVRLIHFRHRPSCPEFESFTLSLPILQE